MGGRVHVAFVHLLSIVLHTRPAYSDDRPTARRPTTAASVCPLDVKQAQPPIMPHLALPSEQPSVAT